MCRYYESHTPAAVKPLGVFSAVSEQQGRRSDIELLGGQRLLAPASSAAPRSTAPMKSAKQRRQSRVIGPLLPWLRAVCFTKPAGCLFFLAFDICPFWCRKASTAHTGAFCHSDLLVACVCLHCCRRGGCMWSGALIYLVVLGMVARVDAQVAGQAGARYFSFA